MEDETTAERFHYDPEALRRMETTVRAEMRSEGLSYDQVEVRVEGADCEGRRG
ncbi:MAG: hypothetical protein JJT81_07380 [Rubellimicrobium sp.]|nr:hypothetical protein [Rubellimicrobium sp.]